MNGMAWECFGLCWSETLALMSRLLDGLFLCDDFGSAVYLHAVWLRLRLRGYLFLIYPLGRIETFGAKRN